MIAGVFFLFTLRQALGLEFSWKYVERAYVPIAFFTGSEFILASGVELPPAELLMVISEGLFVLGLMTALATIPRAAKHVEESKP